MDLLEILFPVLYTGLIPLAIIVWSWQRLNKDVRGGGR